MALTVPRLRDFYGTTIVKGFECLPSQGFNALFCHLHSFPPSFPFSSSSCLSTSISVTSPSLPPVFRVCVLHLFSSYNPSSVPSFFIVSSLFASSHCLTQLLFLLLSTIQYSSLLLLLRLSLSSSLSPSQPYSTISLQED